ncbi:MAG: SDR family NAD(P)-dependent oxidoreductase, partial [Pseudomonadota bacterium]
VVADRPGREIDAVPPGPLVETHAFDLTDIAARDEGLARIAAAHPAIDLAVYNAGITQIGPFEGQDDAAHRRVFEVNYFAAVACAQAFLAPVRAAKGVHLAISSAAGFMPLFQRTSYAASKHALEGFFKSLRSEESAHGVATVIAAPSFVATNIGAPEREETGVARPGSAPDGVDYMGAEDAARIILQAAARRRPFAPVGRVARLSWLLGRLSPAMLQRVMERNIAGR